MSDIGVGSQYWHNQQRIEKLEKQLAESQAREKVLREAITLAIARTNKRLYATCPDCDYPQQCDKTKTCVMCKNIEPELNAALALPQDSTALDELMAVRLDDYYTELLHPAFGLAWTAPYGELYRAHKQGQIDALEEGADNLSKLSEVGVGEFELRRMAQKLREEN